MKQSSRDREKITARATGKFLPRDNLREQIMRARHSRALFLILSVLAYTLGIVLLALFAINGELRALVVSLVLLIWGVLMTIQFSRVRKLEALLSLYYRDFLSDSERRDSKIKSQRGYSGRNVSRNVTTRGGGRE